jgi:hypothetical protein
MTAIPITNKTGSSRGHTLYVASEPNMRGHIGFDLSTYHGSSPMGTHACVDINREEAEAIVAALRTAFPAPAPEVPDVELPDLYENEGGPVPTAVSVELDCRSLTLVNWLDFKGWEVRRRASRDGEAGLLLGYISGSDSAWRVEATRPVPVKRTDTVRVDEALRFLIKAANA